MLHLIIYLIGINFHILPPKETTIWTKGATPIWVFLQRSRHPVEFWRVSPLACFSAIKLTWFPFNNSFPKIIYITKALSKPRGKHLSTCVQFWKAESPSQIWVLWNYWHICPNMLLCSLLVWITAQTNIKPWRSCNLVSQKNKIKEQRM